MIPFVTVPENSKTLINLHFMIKTALITGATSGIGKATATLLAQNNFKIVLCGRRKDRLEALEKELRSGNYFNNFKMYMAKGGLLFNLDNQKEKVLFYLQAEFVRQLFNEKAYYQLILKKAIIYLIIV